MAATVLSGAAFGAAMAAAGFHDPAAVLSQLKLEDWHMGQAFLAATAASAAIYFVAERRGYVNIPPRMSSPLGLFSKYDGNVLGGALLGMGMTLGGSCPGALYAMRNLRRVCGGILWTGIVSKGVQRLREKNAVRPEREVVNEQLGLSKGTVVLLLETACVGAIAATMTLHTPASGSDYSVSASRIPGAVGGLMIGGAQLVSILTRRSMRLVGGADITAKTASYGNILFASGVVVGAWGFLKLLPGLASASTHLVSPRLAMTGGVLMAVGSRMAGGCTSGHGISGISLLLVSSVVTIVTAFVVGALVAPLAH
ncbi:hypothetical protein E4U59_002020 [Claviceps monticola]|nr:hypothetical protein E4U59_002020 [Claviceps monticola]